MLGTGFLASLHLYKPIMIALLFIRLRILQLSSSNIIVLFAVNRKSQSVRKKMVEEIGTD